MIMIQPIQPTVRPGGGPVQAGDIWINFAGVRRRFDGVSAWPVYSPVIIYSSIAPNALTGRPDGTAVEYGDIWIHSVSGGQGMWTGAFWEGIDLPAGIMPRAGEQAEHLAKDAQRDFDARWVDPADGIAFVHEQQTASSVWTIQHNLRSRVVSVIAIDSVGTITMVPDILYAYNQCQLTFAEAVSGYALIHAAKATSDIVV
jgi:hypothetical protein